APPALHPFPTRRSSDLLVLAAAGALAAATSLAAAEPQTPPVRAVDLKAPDGAVLKGTFFAAAAPGPGVILFHQSNRDRGSWAGRSEEHTSELQSLAYLV